MCTAGDESFRRSPDRAIEGGRMFGGAARVSSELDVARKNDAHRESQHHSVAYAARTGHQRITTNANPLWHLDQTPTVGPIARQRRWSVVKAVATVQTAAQGVQPNLSRRFSLRGTRAT